MDGLSYADVQNLTGGKIGRVDVACPDCGPRARAPVNRTRKVLRIWDDGEFATYNCARCGLKGWAKAVGSSKTEVRPVGVHEAESPRKDTAAIAASLWHRSLPLNGSPAETYLRSRSCFVESPSLRFLPGRDIHPPAMIARFGRGSVTGIHITRLRADGSGKAGTDKDKIMLGESAGHPIVIVENPARGELLISEGIEDAATLAGVTGWSAWAAGSAGRLASVVAGVDNYERIYLAVDHDRTGLRALAAVRSICPDVVPIDFAKVFGIQDRLDANKVLLAYGAEAVMAAIEWAAAQTSLRRGEIRMGEMLRVAERINGMISRLGLST